MKLHRTPVFLELDRPRRIVFNMHVRAQMEEMESRGELNISEIFQEHDGQRRLNWTHAMRFLTVALREDAHAHGEDLSVEDVEREIDSVPVALAYVSQVFDEYGKFLGIAPGEKSQGEGEPATAKGKAGAGGAAPAGHAKRLSVSSAVSTESLPANSGD
jgi:hypothetical protein